ncbi:MAG: hypothetical protein M3N34_00925 [Pseudomonadota bacterium]|nr:hypothetical protein [Pseudomonadota bacterium]
MAYLDLSDVFLQGNALAVPTPAELSAAPIAPASFEHTEWAVIALARADGLATLRAPGRSRLGRSRLGRLLFGQPRSYDLAAARLEALRRLAIEAWYRPLTISLPALGAFIAEGFTSAQLALLLSATGALRAMDGLNAESSAFGVK